MHSDPAFELLLPNLRVNSGPSLWVIDENITPYLSSLFATADALAGDLHVLSNRYDIFLHFKSLGIPSSFNDFDFDALALPHFNHIYYRISKEKPVVHRIINQALAHLAPEGELYLAGAKQEGIQSYLTNSAKITSCALSKTRGKQQTCLGVLSLPNEIQVIESDNQLEDKNYTQSREIVQTPQFNLHSKPGVFCWDRLDPGSLFLSQHFEAFLAQEPSLPNSCLDLGCGYGFLAATAHHHKIKGIVATDNNAAALHACQLNFDLNNIPGQVIAADCGQSIKQQFDLVLCNPPFHHGFKTDPALTQKFLSNAARLTAKGGQALFVVNQFISIENLARKHFNKYTELANDNSFKLVVLE